MNASLFTVFRTADERMLRESVGREEPGMQICRTCAFPMDTMKQKLLRSRVEGWGSREQRRHGQAELTGVTEIDNTLGKVIL
jgi:hypothetical protein